MTTGPVRVIGAGVVLRQCVQEVHVCMQLPYVVTII